MKSKNLMIEDIRGCSKDLLKLLSDNNIKYYSTFLEKVRKSSVNPNLEQVRKYLREELKIDVVVDPIDRRGFLQWLGAFRYTNRTINNHFHEAGYSKAHESYDDALEETLILAIKYEKSK